MIWASVRTAWSLITSRAGLTVIAVAAVLGALALWGHARYVAGGVDQFAKDDKIITALRAGAVQCATNVETLKDEIIDRNGLVEAQSKADLAALAKAKTDLTKADAQAARYRAQLASWGKPLAAGDACAQVMEADQRLLGTLAP